MTLRTPYRSAAGNTPRPLQDSGLPRAYPVTLTALCLLGLVLPSHPALAREFVPPDLAGYSLVSERDADGDGDGVNETHIVKYVNPQADSLVSLSTNGITWAWSLNTHDSEIGTSNYVIRDSDCDGTYDEVYGLDEEFHVPDCLK
jgi:hypothetical protein